MTSGIRSNWMKAIRLCMDLQNSNKNKSASQSTDTSSLVSPRTNDDMEIDTAASASRLTHATDNTKPPEKKEFTRNIRRHYSDVNPGNIGKMFSIKGLAVDSSKAPLHSLTSQSSTSSSLSSPSSSKEPSVERESRAEQKTSPPRTELSAVPKQYPGLQHTWHGDGIPFRRFVEGSDSHVTPPPSTEVTSKSSSDKKEEEERKRRNKSPSVRIKEKSRAKSPKLHSPPPGHDQEDKFTFHPTISSDHTEEDNLSISSGDLDMTDGDHVSLAKSCFL